MLETSNETTVAPVNNVVLEEGKAYCNTCGGVVDIANVDLCPHCGVRQEKDWKNMLILKLIVGIILLAGFTIFGVLETYAEIQDEVNTYNQGINLLNGWIN